jgi:PKD domain
MFERPGTPWTMPPCPDWPGLSHASSIRSKGRLRPEVTPLERRTLLTSFTQMSPIGLAPLISQIPPAGGLVLDLVGINGGRIETELAPSQLFSGYFNSGTPASYRGNPGTLGIQTGLTPTALRTLGGGLAGVAVRVTMSNGQTGPGEPFRNDNFLLLNGILLGDFSNVVTQQTTSDGNTALSLNPAGGFRTNSLDTGFFSSTDPVLLSSLYSSIARTGQVVYQFQDSTPYSQAMNFTAGLDQNLANPGPIPVFAIDPPLITSVKTTSPIDEGGSATISVTARTAHENPRQPPLLSYQFDVVGNGSYSISNQTGVVTLAFFHPGTYVIPIRVVTAQGTFATSSATIQVANVAPSLQSPGNQTATEGAPASFDLGSFTDPGRDSPWSVTINWGDGSTSSRFTTLQTGDLCNLDHTYELDGTYQVTLSVADSLGATTAEAFPIVVANVPPSLTTLAVTSPIRLGGMADLSLTFSDPGRLDTFHLTVNWGDHSVTSAFLGVGTRTFTSSHLFALNPGLFAITVTITDHGDGQAFGSSSVQVVGPTFLPAAAIEPPLAQSSVTSLAFFSSSSSTAKVASSVTTPSSLLALNQLPRQALPTRKSPPGGRGGPPPPGKGRSLEELLAILLTQPAKSQPGRVSPFDSLASQMNLQSLVTSSSGQAPPSAGAITRKAVASQLAAQDGEERTGGAASRIMILVVWTLSLRNRRWRRIGRRSYSTGPPTPPQRGV